jgi:hypothetical protein
MAGTHLAVGTMVDAGSDATVSLTLGFEVPVATRGGVSVMSVAIFVKG